MDSEGRRHHLSRSGPTWEIVTRKIQTEGFYILRSTPKALRGGLSLKTQHRDQWLQSLESLLAAGLPLKEALQSQDPGSHQAVKRFNGDILQGLQQGESLTSLLSQWKGWSPMEIGLLGVGQESGDLLGVIKKLNSYTLGRKKVESKILSALLYPLFVLVLAFFGVLGLLFFLLPHFATMLQSLAPDAANNLAERIEGISLFMVLFSIGTVGAGGYLWWERCNSKEAHIDSLMLKIPLLKGFLLYRDLQSFGFAMETLLQGGVPLEQALEKVIPVFRNRGLQREMRLIQKETRQGQPLSHLFNQSPLFPEDVTRFFHLGEISGQDSEAFRQVHLLYSRRLNTWLERFMALIEPVMTLMIGGILISMILLFVTPLFSLFGGLL